MNKGDQFWFSAILSFWTKFIEPYCWYQSSETEDIENPTALAWQLLSPLIAPVLATRCLLVGSCKTQKPLISVSSTDVDARSSPLASGCQVHEAQASLFLQATEQTFHESTPTGAFKVSSQGPSDSVSFKTQLSPSQDLRPLMKLGRPTMPPLVESWRWHLWATHWEPHLWAVDFTHVQRSQWSSTEHSRAEQSICINNHIFETK